MMAAAAPRPAARPGIPHRAITQGAIVNPRPDAPAPSPASPTALPADEAALVRAAQHGDRTAFTCLVDRHWTGLHRWLYHLTRDRHAAEDLAQETFLRAFRGLHTFTAGTNFKGWLYRIGHNLFVNHCRAARHAPRHAVPEETPSRDNGPLEHAAGHEAAGRVAEAVAGLSPDFRAALLLRAEQGLSFRDIGQALGITEETARWRVFKARQKLLTALAPAPDRGPP